MILTFLKIYGIAFVVFFILDMIWLETVVKKFYAQQIGFMLRDDVNWPTAIVFYLLFVAGIVIFVINPALAKNSLGSAACMGALFGLITYATYDLTNLTTMKDWPLPVTIVDLLWGSFLACTVASVTFLGVS